MELVWSQGWPGLALMCCSHEGCHGEQTLCLPEQPTEAGEGGGITLFVPDCSEDFMSCPSGEWTWAEHPQQRVLGKLCPPGLRALN